MELQNRVVSNALKTLASLKVWFGAMLLLASGCPASVAPVEPIEKGAEGWTSNEPRHQASTPV